MAQGLGHVDIFHTGTEFLHHRAVGEVHGRCEPGIEAVESQGEVAQAQGQRAPAVPLYVAVGAEGHAVEVELFEHRTGHVAIYFERVAWLAVGREVEIAERKVDIERIGQRAVTYRLRPLDQEAVD